jgi:hypothetical protein
MKAFYPILLAAALGACQSANPGQEHTTGRRDSVVRPDPAPEASRADTTGWVVSPTGIEGLRFGMRLRDLLPRLEPGTDTLTMTDQCEYVSVAAAPDSLGFMVEDRRLVRVDVWGHRTPTAEGARVGDSEGRILELYPRARRKPHEYVEGSYLIVLAEPPVDTAHRYVFETDGSRVTTYRAGLFPQVEYIEGCS